MKLVCRAHKAESRFRRRAAVAVRAREPSRSELAPGSSMHGGPPRQRLDGRDVVLLGARAGQSVNQLQGAWRDRVMDGVQNAGDMTLVELVAHGVFIC